MRPRSKNQNRLVRVWAGRHPQNVIRKSLPPELLHRSTSCVLNGLDVGAGRGGRTPMTRRSADFESAASASSAIPAQCLN